MKKVLLGLLAMSAVSMAATITGSETATQGTNVWDSSQTHGEIQIKGTVTSSVPVVKYAVYVGNSKESELILPNILVRKIQSGEAKGLFESKPETIYVKKIDGAGAFQDLEATEVVSVRSNIESGDTNYEANTVWLASNNAVPNLRPMHAIGTLGKAVLEKLVVDLKAKYGNEIGTMHVDTNGKNGYNIGTDSGTFTGGIIRIEQPRNGEIQFLTREDENAAYNGFENSKYYPMLVNYLAGGKAMAPNFKLMIKVN